MLRISGLATLCILAISGGSASAQQRPNLTVVGSLQGYRCMMLNLSPEQMRDFNNLPAVMAQPSAGSQKIGVASANMIVAEPRREMDGYLQVLHMDGQLGWVETRMLKPWVNASRPDTRCTPAMMSNSRPGFTYQHPNG